MRNIYMGASYLLWIKERVQVCCCLVPFANQVYFTLTHVCTTKRLQRKYTHTAHVTQALLTMLRFSTESRYLTYSRE